ncbi:Hpt domain-containing protein [Pseudoalteromonas carrageenovora]|uniref:Hpt domain-containing protein n=1 Tax=Pseudoalteromonas TaxID=53246 RepID=UPI0026E41514|nr:Hpt domain-containing protein [Pseudoalteromonas carrageenovora]MDO6635564.1 Hpt domain-containing protein [Pseudoalteromonas carrageenovora]MDO6648230.1 Hpt domain-containing protein [Pseudoalteromonas carrageenovora]
MTQISIDESALESMESLLGEQFPDTLDFCCAEFERLGTDVMATICQDKEAAIRHSHSLKSNAAQFGASSLAEVSRIIEQSLTVDDLAQATDASNNLMEQVKGSQVKLNEWLASR